MPFNFSTHPDLDSIKVEDDREYVDKKTLRIASSNLFNEEAFILNIMIFCDDKFKATFEKDAHVR